MEQVYNSIRHSGDDKPDGDFIPTLETWGYVRELVYFLPVSIG